MTSALGISYLDFFSHAEPSVQCRDPSSSHVARAFLRVQCASSKPTEASLSQQSTKKSIGIQLAGAMSREREMECTQALVPLKESTSWLVYKGHSLIL